MAPLIRSPSNRSEGSAQLGDARISMLPDILRVGSKVSGAQAVWRNVPEHYPESEYLLCVREKTGSKWGAAIASVDRPQHLSGPAQGRRRGFAEPRPIVTGKSTLMREAALEGGIGHLQLAAQQ